MNNNIDVQIHVSDVVYLGGNGQWDWRQSHAAGPYWRIYWNREPGAFIKTIDGENQLTPDKILLMAPGTEYATRTVNAVQHFYVHFSVSEPFSEVSPGLLSLPCRELIDMAAGLADDIKKSNDSYMFPLKLQVYLLTALQKIPAEIVPRPNRYEPRIARVLQLLDAYPTLKNPELAAAVNMSTNSFLDLFRRETGETPQNYSRRKRLDDAAKMLHFGSATIDDIAGACGFCDRYHFSRAFKAEYGLPPAAYRQQAQHLLSNA
mgnify:CR=1 FL=1